MKRRYTIHVQDAESDRVVEWSGNKESDSEARMAAQAAAFTTFGNSGHIIRINFELESEGTARLGAPVREFEPLGTGEVPALMVPKDKRDNKDTLGAVIKGALKSMCHAPTAPPREDKWEHTLSGTPETTYL